MLTTARTWLAPVGAAAALASLTATLLLEPRAGGPDAAAVVEPLVLLALAFAVARWAARALLVTPMLVVALGVLVLRYAETPGLSPGGKALAVALWAAAGTAVALLGWGLRALAQARTAAQQADTYRRRLAVAAELHDFVAHDLTELVARIQAARYLGAVDLEKLRRPVSGRWSLWRPVWLPCAW
ncbi:histidine kinase [Kribbella sandramycini]|uniref:Histidine kinase n=1 Tax=Kribbella sandramycini TaxID=60450 RepID=A0A7Y4KUK4_9ACTN|nr:histidine kinase [Kribbella sandramycini]MBB6568478.1 signal transduction histidine kinase [Kribbella sandramycini]NOL38932.1 histidine kinase [Kribbella sandramycini]